MKQKSPRKSPQGPQDNVKYPNLGVAGISEGEENGPEDISAKIRAKNFQIMDHINLQILRAW